MKNKINFIIFWILTLFLTGVIFLIDIFFSQNDLKNISEEKHIEESLFSSEEEIDKNSSIKYIEIAKNIIKESWEKNEEQNIIHPPAGTLPSRGTKAFDTKGRNEYRKIKPVKINFAFIPNTFKTKQEKNKSDIWKTLHSDIFYSFLKEINVLFYEKKGDVRWKMKNKQVKIFWPQYMEKDELIWIFIHEFAHYIDIYSLNRDDWKDVSNEFYNISWNSTKTIKGWLKQKDFVSGYSMTNKYEDFAESLTYYVLHNRDFLEKSINSNTLRKKYNFFNLILFKSEIFKNTDFSEKNKVKNYYRDITKIDFSRKNFLQYLEKSI